MKLLRQIGEIVILLIVIVAIGGFILFAIAGVGAITGIQFIGNILMPTDENGRYLCAGLNAWDEGVCDTSQNTFGLNGINGMFAGAGFLLALAIIAGIVALGLGNYTGRKTNAKHPILLTVIEAPLIIAPTAWIVSTYRHAWPMIVLSIIICLFGIIYTYGANADPAMSRAQREDMRNHNGMLNGGISGLVDVEMSRREQVDPWVPLSYVQTITNMRND